jgi:hypothetical protein
MEKKSNTLLMENDLPLVRHLDIISRLKRATIDFKTSLSNETTTLEQISSRFQMLPYLKHQLENIEQSLVQIEVMWDRSFSEIYSLNGSQCAKLVEQVVAKYEQCPLQILAEDLFYDL